MHKGIRLILKLWIEGEDEPAHNFAAHTMEAVREILTAGHSRYPELQIVVRSIKEDTDWEENEIRPA